ncbi:MAG TPA: DNA repair protein RecN, partial [Vicinamibacteria bacterium]|nr:DNA repair protein RecN [Vicinamibacteria bacterium]
MLKLLKIKNIALIDEVELDLGPGLTLLTGETGAGKSILIDALGLLLGARASADLIRTGEEVAVVEAILDSPDVRRALERHGLPADDDEIVLRREVHASGKGRATVNGALVPISVLRELAPFVANIHGQHEPQGLLDPQTHLDLVDHHAHLDAESAAMAEPYRRLREVEAALESLRRDRREDERRREMLDYQAVEIDRAGLQTGEEEALRQEKKLQANAGRLAELSSEAHAALYEDEEAVLARLGLVYRKIEELSRIDPRFTPYVEGRAAVRAQLDDLALFLRDYRESLQVSPGRLDEIETRLALIERLKRKYGASVEDVLAFGEKCRAELREMGSPEERERALGQEREALAGRYLAAATALSRKRRTAARDLEKKVQGELALLAMERTRFQVSFTPDTPTPSAEDTAGWNERGLETAEFLLSPNPGEDLRPLARIASGGELSRILLALKSVASLDARGKTLVFDEVDAGIGGRVAEVVGRKLRDIAQRHQVLCVTHLPQIASMADRHLVVRKQIERGRTTTHVALLDPAARVEEVARMLGGETVTDAARRHAR